MKWDEGDHNYFWHPFSCMVPKPNSPDIRDLSIVSIPPPFSSFLHPSFPLPFLLFHLSKTSLTSLDSVGINSNPTVISYVLYNFKIHYIFLKGINSLNLLNTGYQGQFSWHVDIYVDTFFIGSLHSPFVVQRENPFFKQDAEQDGGHNSVGNILSSEPELEQCLSTMF